MYNIFIFYLPRFLERQGRRWKRIFPVLFWEESEQFFIWYLDFSLIKFWHFISVLLRFLSNIIDEEEFLHSSTTAQPNKEPQPKKNDVYNSSTTVLGISKGIQMTISEQLQEDWMDTSDKENMQV